MTLGDISDEKSQLTPKEDRKLKNSILLENENHFERTLVNWRNKGVSVIWKHLKVTAYIKKQNLFRSTIHTYKEIIHEVNGVIKPCTLVAILGASGSGKSTLMAALANRQSSDLKVQGDVRVNGKNIQMKYIRQISGFVYQDDLFVSTLTVTEHLNLAAQLKLDQKIDLNSRKQIILDLLTAVGLLKCANSFIGTSRYGNKKMNLSGGEQKRLSVATELITDPALLFCDEPTTGLDSYSALKLMTVMKNLTTERNKTIVCSIHQPNKQIFELFDHIILLHNGDVAFSGTTKNALTFFQSLDYPYHDDQNPADYLVKCLAVVPGRENETAKLASDICGEFKNSKYAKEMNNYIENENKKLGSDFMDPNKINNISWFFRLYLMVHRNFLVIIRDPSVLGLRLINKQLQALLIGVCLMDTATFTQEGIQSMKGILFTMMAENCLTPMYAFMNHIPNQMPVFSREYSNNINSPLIFYLSNLLSLLPGFLLDPVIFATILYWLSGLRRNLYIFLWTLLVNVLVLNTSAAFGMFLSVITNNFNMALVWLTPFNTIYATLSGIFINFKTIPAMLSWVRYISWMAYGIEALFILQLQDVDYIECRADPNIPCLKNGAEVLAQLDFNANNLWRNILCMSGLCLILHIVTYCVLTTKLYFRTKSR